MKEYGVKLGSALFTLVEPRPGQAVEYNRWYERDHFYAGCLIGPWNFAGRRFVATRRLKALRYPPSSPITPEPQRGSYLALYWILDGHHDDWNRWAVDQVNWLHANGRMFAERDHVHTLLYDYEWAVQRDADGVSAELALDHPFAGLVAVIGEAAEGVSRAEVSRWYRDEHLPTVVRPGSPAELCLSFAPLPLLADAPGDVPRAGADDRRFLHLWFLDTDPAEVWDDRFAGHGDELDTSGLGTLLWASPFLPTVPGTDRYADEI